MVEQFAPGADYRLLVVGDRVVAAARREPAQVIGDGTLDDSPTGRRGQSRPAPRRRSCHGAEQDQARLDRLGRARRARLHARLGSAGRRAGAHPPQCQPEHRRHRRRRDRRGPSRSRRPGDRSRQDGRPGHRRRRRRGARHRPAAGRARRRRSSKSTPAPACGCTSSRRPASRGRWARRSSTRMFAEGQNGRIPIVAVTGVNGKTTTTRFIAHILAVDRSQGRHDLHRRHLHRRPPHRQRRLQRPGQRPERCWSTRWSKRPCWKRLAAAFCGPGWASTAATWPSSPTSAKATTWAWPTSKRWRSWPRSNAASSTSCSPNGYAVLKADDPLRGRNGRVLPGLGDFLRPATATIR